MAAIATLSFVMASPSTSQAQECAAGPKCNSIGKKAEGLIARFQNSSGSASESTKAAYCVNMIVAEISRVCGDELKKAKDTACANLAYQQRDENIRVAKGAEESLKGFYTGEINWKKDCGWR